MAPKHMAAGTQHPSQAATSGPKTNTKRAPHTKARTGCKTCRVRRVRCDELKPACKRCVTTGRKCDGYATTAAYPLPTAQWSWRAQPVADDLLADQSLVRSKKEADELYSYRYFVEVTAPSIAAAMQREFWLDDVTRVCHYDDAIWHAVVSLASAHKSYVSGVAPKSGGNVFTLQHYNNAIRRLTEDYSPDKWWRALIVSTIFTAICCLESRYEESRIHFRSGYNLLREFDRPDTPGTPPQEGSPRRGNKKGAEAPINLSSIRAMMIKFEMQESRIYKRKVSRLPSLLSANDSFALWRSYCAPQLSHTETRYLIPRNINDAIKAVESLYMELLFSAARHANTVKAYFCEGRMDMLEALGSGDEPHLRCFKELEKAIGLFEAEYAATLPNGGGKPKESQLHIHQAVTSLRVMHTANRLMLRRDPDQPDQKERYKSLPALCEKIVDLAEQVISSERKHGCIISGGPYASPTITFPMVVVAQSGFSYPVRRRAIDLLLRPRLEGLGDTLLAANFAEVLLKREMEATIKYSKDPAIKRIEIDSFTGRGWEAGDDKPKDEIHPMARIFNYTFSYPGGRRARLELYTWWEWLNGTSGNVNWINW